MGLLEISKQNKKLRRPYLYGLLAMLSVMRGYNIFVLIIAQYLASIFIFSAEKPLKSILLDFHLFVTVFSTSLVVASGYIINSFYDFEMDKINKPIKSKIDNFISQKTKLQTYFFLNATGFLLGFIVSWRAALFFAVYIFLIWLYSHKLKKHPLLGLLSSSVLAMLPFFVVFVYHKNFSKIIFTHAAFLFFIIAIRELIKDLEGIKGAFANDYQTIPVKYGERFTKILISLIVVLSLNPVYFLWKYPEIGEMKYYFYLVFVVFVLFPVFLWRANSIKQYNILHNVLKFLIVLGVFSLALIDTSVLITRLL
jgi:4-hydroxybenzoate polyprenyltransferase